jgi:hypothetical protein
MTVALLLAAAPDRLAAMAHPYQRAGDGPAVGAPWLDFMGDRLMSAGVRQVDVAMCTDAADGLRAVAAIARGTGEPVLVCTSSRALATPRDELAALLGDTGTGTGIGTAALAADGALLVASKDLQAVAEAAETLAARIATGQQARRGHRVSLRRISRRTRVSGDLDSAVDSLIECVSGHGVRVVSLDGNGVRLAPHTSSSASSTGNTTGNTTGTGSNGTGNTTGTGSNGAGTGTGTGNGHGPAAAPPRGRPARAPGRPRPPASPPEPGLVTGLVVAPVASRVARWAPVRGLAPDAFTIAAFALTLCAAAWFAGGSRSSMLAGGALICVALPVRQARGWLAGRSRAATAFGGWLTALTGAAGEYAVYAGLAVGWAGVSPRHAWGYATAAMILLAVRQTADGCYAAVAGSRPGPQPARPAPQGPRPGPKPTPPGQQTAAQQTAAQQTAAQQTAGTGHRLLRLTGQSIALPAAERTLLIAVTAAIWGPRIALAALIGWGAVALGYVLAERSVSGRPGTQAGVAGSQARSQAGHPGAQASVAGSQAAARPAHALIVSRDDGPLASRIGAVVQGQLPPLLPAIAGITVTAMLAALGLHNMPGVLLLAPAVAMLLAALGADSPHTGRFDWLVPPLLQAGQYVYLTAVAFAANVPAPATYVLIAAIALHHVDVLVRERHGIAPSPRVTAAGLGWEGRMLVVGFGGMLGFETFVCIALAGYLWVLFAWDSLTDWADLIRA